jgi:hypothetical protein
MGGIVVGGLQAMGSIVQGNMAAAQGEERQMELKREAELSKIAAEQSQTSRLNDLKRTMGAISALTAQRNLDPGSPSAFAYAGGVQKEAQRSIQNEAFNSAQQIEAMRLAGLAARQSGNAAQMSGYLTGAGQFIQSIDDAFAKAAAAGG